MFNTRVRIIKILYMTCTQKTTKSYFNKTIPHKYIPSWRHIEIDKPVHTFEHAKVTHTGMSFNIVFRQA